VIVFVVYGIGIFADETKGDTPVPAHSHWPITLAITAQLMKTQTGEIHILRARGCLNSAQNKAQPFSMLCWIPALLPCVKKRSKPLCLNPLIMVTL
jgi:hypothetical protein